MKRTLTIIGILLIIIGEALAQHPGLSVIVEPHVNSLSPGIKILGTSLSPPPSEAGIFRGPTNNSYYSPTSQDILRENEREIAEMIQRQTLALSFASQGFPSRKRLPGTEYFYSAYRKINAMLTDSLPLDLGEAVFLVENAMLGNKLDYSLYQKQIDKRAALCRLMMRQEKLSESDNLAKNNVLYRLFTQTITVRQPGTEKVQDVKKGNVPAGIVRFDKGKIEGEQPHVHFKDGSALNQDGTWKHGGTELTNKQIKYLEDNGWTIPQ